MKKSQLPHLTAIDCQILACWARSRSCNYNLALPIDKKLLEGCMRCKMNQFTLLKVLKNTSRFSMSPGMDAGRMRITRTAIPDP